MKDYPFKMTAEAKVNLHGCFSLLKENGKCSNKKMNTNTGEIHLRVTYVTICNGTTTTIVQKMTTYL